MKTSFVFSFAWGLAATTSALSSPTVKLMKRLQLKVIKRNENVVFFPTSAYQNSANDEWILPIHGWVFDDERRGLRRRAFLALLRSALNRGGSHKEDEHDTNMIIDNDEEEILLQEAEVTADDVIDKSYIKQLLARRVLPFIVDNHRRRKITLKIGSLEKELPERSRKNGHFFANLRLSEKELAAAKQDENTVQYEALTGLKNDARSFQGTSMLVPPTGLSVISDIDDTVKVSHVLDKKRLIRHTFLEEFQAVPGMAQLYQTWKKQHGAVFHYVSSSPWQLYQEIDAFFHRTGFPQAASFHLKSIRLKDKTLLDLFADPMASKIAKIAGIIDTWPSRQFVLVGDTGERDPEVYGEICRRYPNRVRRVFLRDVTSQLSHEVVQELNKKQQKKKSGIVINGPDRFDKAFRNVPTEKWSLFTDASTIEL